MVAARLLATSPSATRSPVDGPQHPVGTGDGSAAVAHARDTVPSFEGERFLEGCVQAGIPGAHRVGAKLVEPDVTQRRNDVQAEMGSVKGVRAYFDAGALMQPARPVAADGLGDLARRRHVSRTMSPRMVSRYLRASDLESKVWGARCNWPSAGYRTRNRRASNRHHHRQLGPHAAHATTSRDHTVRTGQRRDPRRQRLQRGRTRVTAAVEDA